jgi:hemolysin D
LSRDAVQDENLGLVFPARVELMDFLINIDGRDQALSAGLAVSAEIKTGRRRIIEFLLAPLQRRVEEAGRKRGGSGEDGAKRQQNKTTHHAETQGGTFVKNN